MGCISHILLGATAMERWAGTRRLMPPPIPRQWFLAVGLVALAVLVVLLVVSVRRRQAKMSAREDFGACATRRGLNARERQILLAIAVRSGLPQTQEIFHNPEAFQQGALQLLAECARTRTPQEVDVLKAEIVRLRLKLGFQKAAGGTGPLARTPLSSRDIPVGKLIELTGRQGQDAVVVQAEVLRNEEMELAVLLRTPVDSKPGDSWLARCYAGLSAWEFRTSTLDCRGQRLVLSHSDETHFINRRRFLRVPLRTPALVAHCPFLRPAAGGDPLAGSAPVFVESTVTEFAGPGVRLETPLQVHVGDRLLVVFQLPDKPGMASHTVAALGQVKHGRDLERQVPIPDAIDQVLKGAGPRDFQTLAPGPLAVAVELTGLNEEEIEELVSLANKLFSRSTERPRPETVGAAAPSSYEGTAP